MTPLGRLLGELLRLSDPDRTHFDAPGCCWLDAAGQETLGPATLTAMSKALGVIGLGGLDKLLGLRIAEV